MKTQTYKKNGNKMFVKLTDNTIGVLYEDTKTFVILSPFQYSTEESAHYIQYNLDDLKQIGYKIEECKKNDFCLIN